MHQEIEIQPGTLVKHKIFKNTSGQVARYGILLSQNYKNDQSYVCWNHCDEFPVNKFRSNYRSFVQSQYLEIVSEMPHEDYL